jgi:hypothetical protein
MPMTEGPPALVLGVTNGCRAAANAFTVRARSGSVRVDVARLRLEVVSRAAEWEARASASAAAGGVGTT